MIKIVHSRLHKGVHMLLYSWSLEKWVLVVIYNGHHCTIMSGGGHKSQLSCDDFRQKIKMADISKLKFWGFIDFRYLLTPLQQISLVWLGDNFASSFPYSCLPTRDICKAWLLLIRTINSVIERNLLGPCRVTLWLILKLHCCTNCLAILRCNQD